MSDFNCPICGNRLQGGEPCAACNASTAITVAAAYDSENRRQPGRRAPGEDEFAPSIVREYHPSFLRIFISVFLIWTALIGLFVFFSWLAAERAIQAP